MKKVLLTLGLCLIILCTGFYLVNPASRPWQSSPTSVTASSTDIWEHIPDPGGESATSLPGSPWIIRNATDLNSTTMRNRMGQANNNFILMADINLVGFNNNVWTHIPSLAAGNTFDGNNFKIIGLRVTTSNSGLFNIVSGTVKNITFMNPDIESTSAHVGAVAGRVTGGTITDPVLFSRVFVIRDTTDSSFNNGSTATARRRGLVRGTGSASGNSGIGGIVGSVQDGTGSHVRMDSCFNSATISTNQAGHLGGLVGENGNNSAANNANLTIERSANEGFINPTSAVDGFTYTTTSALNATAYGIGGLIGCVDGGQTTVQYSYNRGDVGRGHSGIIGMVRVQGNVGRVSINNTFNDAAITSTGSGTSMVPRAAMTVRTDSTEIWASNNYNNIDKFALTGNNRAFGFTTTGGANIAATGLLHAVNPFTNANLANAAARAEIVRGVNTGYVNEQGQEAEIFSIGLDGVIRLNTLTRSRTIEFSPAGGPGEPHPVSIPFEQTSYTIPADYTTVIADRLGFTFTGWMIPSHPTNQGPYAQGATITNLASLPTVVTIQAQWQRTNYNLVFENGDGALNNVGNSGNPTFHVDINQTTGTPVFNVKTTINPFSAGSVWMIQKPKEHTDSINRWEVISTRDDFSFTDVLIQKWLSPSAPNNLGDFLQDYVDSATNTVTLWHRKLDTSGGFINIGVSTNMDDGGALEYSLAAPNHDPLNFIQMSFRGFPFITMDGGTERDRIDTIRITTNPHYQFNRIEVSGSPGFILTAADAVNPLGANRFSSDVVLVFQNAGFGSLSNLATIRVFYDKIPYKFTVGAVVDGNPGVELMDEVRNINATDSVRVGETVGVSLQAKEVTQNMTQTQSFQFSGWRLIHQNGIDFTSFQGSRIDVGGEFYVPLTRTFATDVNWLTSYLQRGSDMTAPGTIVIQAVYTLMYKVETAAPLILGIGGDDLTSSTSGLFLVSYNYTVGNVASNLPSNGFVPAGSTLEISVLTRLRPMGDDRSFFYELGYFVDRNGNKLNNINILTDGNMSSVSLDVNDNYYLKPVFIPRFFTVSFEIVDGRGDKINLPNLDQNAVSNTMRDRMTSNLGLPGTSTFQPGFVRVGDRFFTTHLALSGFKPALLGNTSTPLFTVNGTPLSTVLWTEDFIMNNINTRTMSITVTAHYIGLMNLSLSITGTGNAMVYKVNQDSSTTLVYHGTGRAEDTPIAGTFAALGAFDHGTKLIIVPEPTANHALGALFDGGDDALSALVNNQLPITIESRRTISLRFIQLPYTIAGNLTHKGFGKSSWNIPTSGDEELGAEIEMDFWPSSTISITATPSFFGSKVKNWTINGTSVKTLINTYGNDTIERFGNSIVITLTNEWLTGESNDIQSHIKFGFTWQFIVFIIVPAILVPLFGIIFLFYFLNLQKKKRVIRAALIADKRSRAGFNQSGIISDLRDGKNVTGVSDDEVKKAMKDPNKKW